jgi:hypothetical protein
MWYNSCLKGLKKTQNLYQDGRSLNCDFNPGPSEYEAGVLKHLTTTFGILLRTGISTDPKDLHTLANSQLWSPVSSFVHEISLNGITSNRKPIQICRRSNVYIKP